MSNIPGCLCFHSNNYVGILCKSPGPKTARGRPYFPPRSPLPDGRTPNQMLQISEGGKTSRIAVEDGMVHINYNQKETKKESGTL